MDYFDGLCISYYEKILRYCFAKLGNESAARDCTQDVFLVALQKEAALRDHPNPGGFLFQTAKNLVKERHREVLRKLASEVELTDNNTELGAGDFLHTVEKALDDQIDESAYVDAVLSRLSGDKQRLYSLYYMENKSMKEISQLLDMEEPAVRMRYVRLRREIRGIVAEISERHFIL